MLYHLSGKCSHDSDSVCNIKSILVRCKSNICLLFTLWSDKCVNLLDLDVVELLARNLDHSLVGFLVNDENESVVVFNGLDGRFTAQWVFDDGKLVEGVIFLHSSQDILRISLLCLTLWSSEGSLVPNLSFFGGMSTFLHCSCCCFGSLYKKQYTQVRITFIQSVCKTHLPWSLLALYPYLINNTQTILSSKLKTLD